MRIDSISLHEVGPFKDVTINFPEGTDPDLADIYLLTGPNGCGKTTVLYAIAALIQNEAGLLRPRMWSESSGVTLVVSDGERSHERAMSLGPAVRPAQPVAPLDGYSANASMDSLRSVRMSWAAFAYAGTRMVESGRVASISEPLNSPLADSLSFHHTANTGNLAQWIASQEFLRLKAKESGRSDRAEQITRSVRAIEEAIARIIEDPSFVFVSGSELDLDVRVRRHGTILDMRVLPDGLKSIVSWVADLLMRLDRI